MRDFKGKGAVVTGAASGIGRALAQRFAAEGMQVVVSDVEQTTLDEVVRDLEDGGARVLGVRADVSKPEQVEALAKQATEFLGPVHVLCNNAGVYTGGVAWKQTLDDWHWVIDVCLWGAIYGVHFFVPQMLEHGEPAHIVNTSSGAGLMSLPGNAPYNVAKHGVVTLTETLGEELRQRDAKIGVSVLCPGPIDTHIADSDRNRPEGVEPSPPSRVVGQLREMIRDGMSPARVAEIVLDGIREERLYILTHAGIKAGVKARMTAILDESVAKDPSAA